MAILSLEKINKFYGNNHVLKDISFSMEKGEVVAIIGSSGGGKSTLLRCLTFLEKIQSGKIVIDGNNVVTSQIVENKGKKTEKSIYPKEEELRKHALKIGLVFQDFNLFPHLSVLENMVLAPTSVLGLSKDAARALAISNLKKVGLEEKQNAYPCDISGGQKQRVAIARALCMQPEILCFDEPTSALDPELTGEVLKVLSELRNTDVTMLIVTHEIMFAREVADKVIFLDGGKVLEMRNAKEIIDSPREERTKIFMNTVLKNK